MEKYDLRFFVEFVLFYRKKSPSGKLFFIIGQIFKAIFTRAGLLLLGSELGIDGAQQLLGNGADWVANRA